MTPGFLDYDFFGFVVYKRRHDEMSAAGELEITTAPC
jgi:hypothetical protein